MIRQWAGYYPVAQAEVEGCLKGPHPEPLIQDLTYKAAGRYEGIATRW